MTNETLKNKISGILVKWDMPTRQIAINEIIKVVAERDEALLKKLEEMKKPIDELYTDDGIDGYNQALEDIKLLITNN